MRILTLPQSSAFPGVLLPTAAAWFLFLSSAAPLHAQQNEKDAVLEAQKKQIDRLALEIEILKTAFKDRDRLIRNLETDTKEYREKAEKFEALAKLRQKQIEFFLETIGRGSGPKVPTVGPARAADEPNPPKPIVNGKIEKIGLDDLVQISLGADHGLDKNHTLEVYRLKPEPKYLGKVRIVEAYFRTSVGRLIPIGDAANRPALKVGDLVTSRLANGTTKKETPEDRPPAKEVQPVKPKAPIQEDARDVEIERLRKANETLKASLKLLNETLLRVEAKQQEASRAAVTLEVTLRAVQNRNEQLLAQLREATRQKAIGDIEALPKVIPVRPNPPQAAVRGIIEKVDGNDPTLVTLSIGGDVGLKAGHTLEVFRLKPAPKYLGTVRVLDVTPQKAIARWTRPSGANIPALQKGDEVAAGLSAGGAKK